VPTSVLLAVLAAAGLLALAPALVRRYDATERLAAERAASTARVIDRKRRRRTVPGARPINLPRTAGPSTDRAAERVVEPVVERRIAEPPARPAEPARAPAPTARARETEWIPVTRSADRRSLAGADRGRRPAARSGGRSVGRNAEPVVARRAAPRKPKRRPTQSPAVYRRRRVLTALVALNVAELIGVLSVSPGFWSGFAVTSVLLVAYVGHLRNEALADRHRRRAAARRAEEIAFIQAEIRAEQAKRVASRREALRRAAAARSAAQREATRLSQRFVDFDPTRGARVRGRAYETGEGRKVSGE
jgi:hypothetical protein